ncbi:hypothetical protein [Haloplasma contractile]|uniref:Uncharacterized protein n=1 Tax=Haloplasma contractile SSD-17B TaxID=1033810 RepID=F7Q1C2_9MOLU|nr:hypothetical protein [Haloplasma contractile]ERJ12838.1 hypothetical protein HLPCO_001178 [Haloplasma contractile SSD-17B]
MIKFAFTLFFRIIKSVRMYLFIFLNIILSSGYYFVSKILNEEKFAISPHYRYNINSFKDTIQITTFTESYYFVTLGFLLWLFILIEVIKYFGTNDSNGILLTHVTNPISRSAYFFSVFIAIFMSFLVISIFNIFFSYGLFIFGYQNHGKVLIKIVFAAILYAGWHILIITSVLSFFVVIIKRTERSIMISGLIIILSSTSIFLKDYLTGVISDYDVSVLNYVLPFTMVDGYPFMFFVRHLFNVFDEGSSLELLSFYSRFGLSVTNRVDPDIGLSVYRVVRIDRIIENLVMIFSMILSGLMLLVATITFNKMDIAAKS